METVCRAHRRADPRGALTRHNKVINLSRAIVPKDLDTVNAGRVPAAERTTL